MDTTARSSDTAAQPRVGRARLALLGMVLIWGINFPIAKAALGEIPPLAFNALRFPLAALVVLIALRLRGPLTLPERADWPRVVVLGILGNVFYQQFFIFGLDNTRAGTASVLLASTPLMTALLSTMSGHERPQPRVWVGVLATFTGIGLVVASGRDTGSGSGHTLLGDLLMVSASASWALYTVGARSLIARYGSVQFTGWTLIIGAIGLVLVGMPDVLATDLRAVSPAAWVGVVYAGALSIAVAYLIWYYGVRQLGNTRTAVFSNLVPVVALGAAWVHLGEVPRPGQVLGAVIIIAGVSMSNRAASGPGTR